MCRHLAYLGAERSLAELVIDPPHSLLHQSYAPQDMRSDARMNADGFGIGWYSGGTPSRYRRACPMWTAAGLGDVCRALRTTAALAAVRSATVGMPVVETACAPFTDGQWLFSHNGVLAGWPNGAASLAARLPAADLLTLEAPTDSALLWALLRQDLRAGRDPAPALARLVSAADAAAPGSRLNLLLIDGSTIYATAWGHSLWWCARPESVTVASEPCDRDTRWTEVPQRHLLVASESGTKLTELGVRENE
ncbi:MAG: ergothioneine biosynthesis protein EgtC [Sciscionella sp.]